MRIASVFAAVSGLLVLAGGCSPELAQCRNGSEEEVWQQEIKRSYPDNRGPRMAPPAIKDHYSPKLIEAEEAEKAAQEQLEVPAVPAPDAAVAVETAAPAPVKNEVKMPDAVKPAEKPAVQPAEKPEVKVPAAAKAEPAPGDEIYVVKGGDTLGGIARKFYGDARRYDIILKANSQTVKSPNGLRPGMKLVIPKL